METGWHLFSNTFKFSQNTLSSSIVLEQLEIDGYICNGVIAFCRRNYIKVGISVFYGYSEATSAKLKPHSHIHDFSQIYADLANRPSYTFRVRYYANFAEASITVCRY